MVERTTRPYGEWLSAKDSASPPEWTRRADCHYEISKIEAVGLGEPCARLV